MVRIIPCNLEMYAVYREGETEVKRRVLAFGLYFDNGLLYQWYLTQLWGFQKLI